MASMIAQRLIHRKKALCLSAKTIGGVQEGAQGTKPGGGWLGRMGRSKSPAGPKKGSREGYQTHTDDIRKKYGDKLV